MLNTCPNCKRYIVEKEILEDGKSIKCPSCGHIEKINRMPLFIITGASGAGKSTVCRQLFLKEKDYIVMESDILWNSYFNHPENNYREYREVWLRMCKNISQIGKPVVLCGCAVPEQFENCLERRYFSEIHYLALVCDGDILRKRLEERDGDNGGIDGAIEFNNWLRENADKTNPKIKLVESSKLNVSDKEKIINDWIYSSLK